MPSPTVTVAHLSQDPASVAGDLPQWKRGDAGEAVALTLAASAGDLHARAYTLWVWTGFDAAGHPAWALPVRAFQVTDYAPKGPSKILARCLGAAVDAGASPHEISLREWRGFTALVFDEGEPEMANPELAELALREWHKTPNRIAVATLPHQEVLDGPAIALAPQATGGEGLKDLAHATGAHPVHVALALIEHGQPPDESRYPGELATSLREWGLDGPPVEPELEVASLAIDDDPCPRRLHARRVLRRLLRIGKVGSQYHTSFDHIHRGAAPDQRAVAREVGEAMIRAGLLGEKPSVGQRHVYLRREALPAIHALIERGETMDSGLAELWTAPAPGS